MSLRTQVDGKLTLASSSADVGDKAPSAGLGLGRTHLTGVAPGPSDGGTAQSLGADNACQLPLAHLVVDLSETRACPVIWNVKEDRKTGFTTICQSYTSSSEYIKQRRFLLTQVSQDKRLASFSLKIPNFSIMRTALGDCNVFYTRHCKRVAQGLCLGHRCVFLA